jgi:hypothetical protein
MSSQKVDGRQSTVDGQEAAEEVTGKRSRGAARLMRDHAFRAIRTSFARCQPSRKRLGRSSGASAR